MPRTVLMKQTGKAKLHPYREDTYNFYDPKHLKRYMVVNGCLAFIISASFCPSCLTSLAGLQRFFIDYFLYSFLLSTSLSYGVNKIIQYSDTQFSWLEQPGRRFAFDMFAVTIFTFLIAVVLQLTFGFAIWGFMRGLAASIVVKEVLGSTILPIVISLGITLFFTSRSFFLEWRQAAVEAEQMRSERLVGQYQSLKDQLNPHFLFNSLNVLSNLVHENPKQAEEFIEKLSRVYRYVLEVQNEELVELKMELGFAKSYLELQQIRFGEKLQFTLPNAGDLEGELPPLSLQLLLENAIKHNSGTRDKPLQIDVKIVDGQIEVSNSLNPLINPLPSTGIGLNNIKQRYSFLSKGDVAVERTEQFFRVSLPIIYPAEA